MAKPPVTSAEDLRPAQGGSYVRQPDGSLVLDHRTLTPDEAEAAERASAAPPPAPAPAPAPSPIPASQTPARARES